MRYEIIAKVSGTDEADVVAACWTDAAAISETVRLHTARNGPERLYLYFKPTRGLLLVAVDGAEPDPRTEGFELVTPEAIPMHLSYDGIKAWAKELLWRTPYLRVDDCTAPDCHDVATRGKFCRRHEPEDRKAARVTRVVSRRRRNAGD